MFFLDFDPVEVKVLKPCQMMCNMSQALKHSLSLCKNTSNVCTKKRLFHSKFYLKTTWVNFLVCFAPVIMVTAQEVSQLAYLSEYTLGFQRACVWGFRGDIPEVDIVCCGGARQCTLGPGLTEQTEWMGPEEERDCDNIISFIPQSPRLFWTHLVPPKNPSGWHGKSSRHWLGD